VTPDTIRFQLDEHLGNDIVEGLRRAGIEAMTAAGAGYRGLPDDQVLARCHVNGAILVTFDDDYLKLHRDGTPHAGIVFCGRRTRTTSRIIAALIRVHAKRAPDDMKDWVEYV
jgi:predicted nuclease of predicted toxin-antitoxin system